MDTFIDLYTFIQSYEGNIIEWLEIPWKGKDKQESLLRLFAGLGLIDKLNTYNICKGNFNLQTISIINSFRDIFYTDNNLINLKDKGDSSDLTGLSMSTKNHLLLTTSKNLNDLHINKLDIDKILTNFTQYIGHTMTLCICTRNNKDFKKMMNNVEESSRELKSIIEKSDTILIDWDDLKQAFHQFKLIFQNKKLEDIFNFNKKPLCLKLHQHMGVVKTMRMKNNNKKQILWGHIQRSGKSYIMGGCIIQDSINKDKCNYLIMTTAPNETLEQQRQVFDSLQFQQFTVITLNGNNKKPVIGNKNIILCSKQFLQNKLENSDIEKSKSIGWLKKLVFDMRFIDESHNGGTTELAKKTLENYGSNSCTVYITATYTKPINDYNISKDNWILWDLEDIKLCQTISINSLEIISSNSLVNDNTNIDRLIEKHGDELKNIISNYSIENIKLEYSKYPEFYILTHSLDDETTREIINNTRNNNYGWSTNSCFLLKQGVDDLSEGKIKYSTEFQNETEVMKLFYNIFGKKDKYGIPDKDYPDSNVFMKRIESICKNPTINSRFIGEGDFRNEPMIIMAFLPQININKISNAIINLLIKNNILMEYEVISINSHTTSNPKKTIEDARNKARISGKKGVLVLSGRQCSLGVSIDNCDTVLLLNNIMSLDMIYQMMFRCMTEGKGKKCGFVIDVNIQRVIKTSIDYSTMIKSELHPKESIKYILQERLINLNGDQWMPTFGNNINKLDTLCNNVYEIYSSDTEEALNHFLNKLKFKMILLTKEDQMIFNTMFSNTKPIKEQLDIINNLLSESDTSMIKDGIEKIKVEKEEEKEYPIPNTQESEKEKEKEKVNYMEILKHIIPLICLLTIHDKNTSFVEMFNLIKCNENIYNILLDQIQSWWGKAINTNIIKRFIDVYIKYVSDDLITNQIIRTVKELFMKNINNNKQLSKIIDKYIIPQELEKKTNAEVSTPYKLRQEMLDKIPVDFWTELHSVFEPCSGKGGFIIDIIDRFMTGLNHIDEKQRYKIIVEQCLYFSDINPTNIFICRLLIDPYSEYKLNFNEGNTLELDIKTKWDIDGFDAVIGNPPYNSSGNTGTGNTIWQTFVKYSLNILIKNGYLCMVHPPGWRKPNTERGKFYGLYELITKENQILYLSIHGIKDGRYTFKCGTRYDWYVIKKIPVYKNTLIKDEKNIELNIDLTNFRWLPNYNINILYKILATANDEKCEIIQSMSAYEPRKNWMSSIKDDDFKFTCIHSTPKSGIRYMYSKYNDKGHFGVSKVIFGESGIYNPIIDINGEYGMTHGAMGIKIINNEEGDILVNILTSAVFKDFINSCLYSSFRIDWNIFKYLRKDFWKEFI